MSALRYWWAGFRWRRFTRLIERQIQDARKAHRPVNHLLQAKQDLLHSALSNARGGPR